MTTTQAPSQYLAEAGFRQAVKKALPSALLMRKNEHLSYGVKVYEVATGSNTFRVVFANYDDSEELAAETGLIAAGFESVSISDTVTGWRKAL
jgi:hypothetical protein